MRKSLSATNGNTVFMIELKNPLRVCPVVRPYKHIGHKGEICQSGECLRYPTSTGFDVTYTTKIINNSAPIPLIRLPQAVPSSHNASGRLGADEYCCASKTGGPLRTERIPPTSIGEACRKLSPTRVLERVIFYSASRLRFSIKAPPMPSKTSVAGSGTVTQELSNPVGPVPPM